MSEPLDTDNLEREIESTDRDAAVSADAAFHLERAGSGGCSIDVSKGQCRY